MVSVFFMMRSNSLSYLQECRIHCSEQLDLFLDHWKCCKEEYTCKGIETEKRQLGTCLYRL